MPYNKEAKLIRRGGYSHADTRITVTFAITSWEQVPYSEPGTTPALARATVNKTFHGELSATSVAELLLCKVDDATPLISVRSV